MSKRLDIALSRIDAFTTRCSTMIQRIDRGLDAGDEEFSKSEFSEKELTDLDSFLSGLAIDLMAGEEIDDSVWRPPMAASYSNWDRSSGDQTAWLKEFRKSLRDSRDFFGALGDKANETKGNGDSISSGDNSNNIVVKEGGSVEINENSGQQLIHRPTMQDMRNFDPRTKELLDKVSAEQPSASKSTVPGVYNWFASHINGWALVLAAVVALLTAADGVINNWDIAKGLIEAITGLNQPSVCDPNILTPEEYDKCLNE